MNGITDVRTRLQDRLTVLLTIDAQQIDHPGYGSDIAAAIIDSELQMLTSESRAYWAQAPDVWLSQPPRAGKRV